MHVEAGVDDGGFAGQPFVFADDLMEAGIDVGEYQLRPRRSVHMDGRGTIRLHLVRAVKRDRHKLRSIRCPVGADEVPVCVFSQNSRCEGHELRSLKLIVQPSIHIWITRVIQDRTIAERPGPVFHAPVEATHHVLVIENFGDRRFCTVREVFVRQSGFLNRRTHLFHRKIAREVNVFLRFRRKAAVPGGEMNKASPQCRADIAHARMHFDALDAGHFHDALVQLHVRTHAARETHCVYVKAFDVFADILADNVFQDGLVGSSYVFTRMPLRDHQVEQEIIRVDESEIVGVRRIETGSDAIVQFVLVAISR